MTIYFIIKVYVNEKFQQKLPTPIPIELMIISIGTMISYYENFKEKYHIKIVGKIQSGYFFKTKITSTHV